LAGIADPDEDLVRRVGHGDPAAIQAMVARKLPRMLALAQRMLGDATEAEDVAQDAMLRAWKQAPRWIPGQARFDTWLHRVTLNLCYDRLRRRREIPTEAPPERPDKGPAPDRGSAATRGAAGSIRRVRLRTGKASPTAGRSGALSGAVGSPPSASSRSVALSRKACTEESAVDSR
jgi:RNA polymerase sigma-70 factor (ECF subfamily)